jgi:hypothetical protein
MVAAIFDIEALRQYRAMNLNSNWLKDLRVELFSKMYTEPIHPKNLWMNQDPWLHEKVDEVYRQNIGCQVKRGTWAQPANQFPGCRYQPSSDVPAGECWDELKKMWWDVWEEED